MASDVKVQVLGLQTSNNIFSAQPGALAKADNCVLNATNQLEPRRGFEAKDYTFGASGDLAQVLAYFGTTLLVQYADKLARDTGSAFTDYSGTYSPVDSTLARMRFLQAAGNLYFNCNDGTRVLETASGTPAQAGVPRALRVTATNVSSSGWQRYNTAVRYSAVWGYKDAAGNEKLGVPSGPFVLPNRISVPAAQLVRTAPDGSHPAGKVSALIETNNAFPHYLQVGDTVVLSPGEADFAAGTKTVVTIWLGGYGFTYNEAGANVSSTLAQDFQATRSSSVRIDIPAGITTSHFFRLYRSVESATHLTNPSDDVYLVHEGQPSGGDIAAGYVTVSDITPTDFLTSAADPLYTNANDGEGIGQANERPPLGLDFVEWDGRAWWANTTQRHRFFLQLLGVGSPAGIQNNDTLSVGGQTYTFKTVAGAPNDVSLAVFGAPTPATTIAAVARELCRVINTNASSVVYAHYLSGESENPGRILLEEKAIGGAAFGVITGRPTAFNPILPSTLVGAPYTAYSDNNRQPHGLLFSKPGQPEAVPIANEVLVGSKNSPILRVCPLRGSLVVFKTDGVWTVSGTGGRYTSEKLGVAKLLAPETVCLFADKVWGLTDQGITNVTDGGGVAVVSYAVEDVITPLFGTALAELKLLSFGVGYESDRRYLCWLPTDDDDEAATQALNHSTATKSFTRWPKAASCGVVDPNTDKLVVASGSSNRVLVERKDFNEDDYQDENGAAYLVEWEFQPFTGGNPALSKFVRQLTLLFKRINAEEALAIFHSELDAAPSTVELSFPGYGDFPYGETPYGDPSVRSKRVCPIPPAHSSAAQLSVGFSVEQAGARWAFQGLVLEYEADTEVSGR